MTLTNVVRTIFYHLRNGQKIVRTTFVRVIVTKPLNPTMRFQEEDENVKSLRTTDENGQQ